MPTLTEATVSDTAWSTFTAADYTPAQWRRACLVDTGEGDEDSKDRYKLPVKQPDGTLNRNAVHAAAGAHGIAAVKGISGELRRSVAKKLVSLYRNQLNEDPPDSLLRLAGENTTEAAAPGRCTVSETRALVEAAVPDDGPGRLLVTLITPGWGSSGYYSPAVLQQAAEGRVFPAGMHMYIDHPTDTEEIERPERSVRDLAAVLTEDARWTGKGLVAQARVYSPWRTVLADLAPDIGASIRAVADMELGEAEDRRGRIITALTEGLSVDFVTRAGRGGTVTVLESATPAPVRESRNIGQWVEASIHRDFTSLADSMFGDGRLTRDERITLSSAIGDALNAFVTRVEADAPQLYSRDLWDNPPDTVDTAAESLPDTAESATGAPGAPNTVPVTPAGPTTQDSEEETMPTIEEARLRQLEEASGRVPALEAERDKAVAERDDALRRASIAESTSRARDLARRRVVEAAPNAATQVVDRIVAEATRDIPLTDDNRLDVDTLNTAIDEARAAEEAYLSRLLDEADGGVRGLGGTDDTKPLTEADIDALHKSVFGVKGV